jgi:hypothetical protein
LVEGIIGELPEEDDEAKLQRLLEKYSIEE